MRVRGQRLGRDDRIAALIGNFKLPIDTGAGTLPSYRNQDLRKTLRLKTGSEGSRAHRAADDAYVTAALLRELLRRYAGRSAPQSISGLIEMITSPIR